MELISGSLVFADDDEKRRVLRFIAHPDFKFVERAFELMEGEAAECLVGLTGLEKSAFEVGRQIGRLQQATDWFRLVMDALKAGALPAEVVDTETDMSETEAPPGPGPDTLR